MTFFLIHHSSGICEAIESPSPSVTHLSGFCKAIGGSVETEILQAYEGLTTAKNKRRSPSVCSKNGTVSLQLRASIYKVYKVLIK